MSLYGCLGMTCRYVAVQLLSDRALIMVSCVGVQIWLPVRLVQGRIENEIKANLSAVRRYAEGQYARQGSASRQ